MKKLFLLVLSFFFYLNISPTVFAAPIYAASKFSCAELLTRRSLISKEDVMRNLSILKSMPGVSEENGVFGPNSVMWEVAKEDNLQLFSPVIGYPQLMHPGSVEGLNAHSQIFHNPTERLNRTVKKILQMVYGRFSEASRLAIGLNIGHSHVTGIMPYTAGHSRAGDEYSANEPVALLVVHMSHWQGVLKLYEFLHGRQSQTFRDQYYTETVKFGLLMGLPIEILPSTEHEYAKSFDYLFKNGVFGFTPTTEKALIYFYKLADELEVKEIEKGANGAVAIGRLINPIGSILFPDITNRINREIGRAVSRGITQHVRGTVEMITAANLDPRVYAVLNIRPPSFTSSEYDSTRKAVLRLLPRKIFDEYVQAMRRVSHF